MEKQVKGLTFTEADIKEAATWFNFINKNAKWSGDKPMTSIDCQNVGRLMTWMHKHIKYMESHLFEIKEVQEISEEERAAYDAEHPGLDETELYFVFVRPVQHGATGEFPTVVRPDDAWVTT